MMYRLATMNSVTADKRPDSHTL